MYLTKRKNRFWIAEQNPRNYHETIFVKTLEALSHSCVLHCLLWVLRVPDLIWFDLIWSDLILIQSVSLHLRIESRLKNYLWRCLMHERDRLYVLRAFQKEVCLPLLIIDNNIMFKNNLANKLKFGRIW